MIHFRVQDQGEPPPRAIPLELSRAENGRPENSYRFFSPGSRWPRGLGVGAPLGHDAPRLDPIHREVLAMRHFEQLGPADAAQMLGISREAGAKRYFRALKRLKDLLATLPGGWEGL